MLLTTGMCMLKIHFDASVQFLTLSFLLSFIVGYGDIVPHTKGGKLFATVYILVAGTILLNNMSMISMIPLELRRRRTEMAVLNQVSSSPASQCIFDCDLLTSIVMPTIVWRFFG